MKTADKLKAQREQNNKQIGDLISLLHELHLENQDLNNQLSLLPDSSEEEEDIVTASSPLKKGDRAVCLSPGTSHRGDTGHIESFTTTKGFATFCTDNNKRYSVKPNNLFRLKKKGSKSKATKQL